MKLVILLGLGGAPEAALEFARAVRQGCGVVEVACIWVGATEAGNVVAIAHPTGVKLGISPAYSGAVQHQTRAVVQGGRDIEVACRWIGASCARREFTRPVIFGC